MPESQKALRVFLSYATPDGDKVKALYRRLIKDNVDAWFDKSHLLGGERWKEKIEDEIYSSDAVIICLSNQSIAREGYFQKEMKLARECADLKPVGSIYLIPVRLEDCKVPRDMADYQWVDLYTKSGYGALKVALNGCAEAYGRTGPTIEYVRDEKASVATRLKDVALKIGDKVKAVVTTWHAEVVVVHCIDFRLQYYLNEWLEKRFGKQNYDRIS